MSKMIERAEAKSAAELVPEFIRRIAPYVPGRPIEEVERQIKMHAIKLASNENPLGPSPMAAEAAKKALAGANRYPDGGGHYLRGALSKRHGIPIENIILGNGSTDLIDLSARLVLRAGGCGVTSYGSFPLYGIAIHATGARYLEIPMKGRAFDLDAMARELPGETRIVFLANPNNPTGTMFTADEFENFLARVPENVLVVLDEAYCDYVERADYSRSMDAVREGRNVIVLRTFSKVYGLAGLRIGYGVGPAALLEEINKIRGPFNTSCVAQAAGLAALGDAAHVKRSVEVNRAGLKQLGHGLDALGVRYEPSHANFVFVEFDEATEGLTDALLKRGVIVRPMRWMGFGNAIRVSVGTAEENETFLRVLAEVLRGGASGVTGDGKR